MPVRIALGYPIAVLYVALCVGVACLLSRCGLPRPYTRKTVHILVGFEWVILAAFFGAGIHTLLVSLLFTALLALDARKKLLAPLSSDGGTARGTVYYGLGKKGRYLVGRLRERTCDS